MKDIPYRLMMVPLGDLAITERADRPRPDDGALRESLRRHGVLVPLLVAPTHGGGYAVLDGCRRIRLLKEMGLTPETRMPVLVREDLGQDDLLARLAANRYHARLSTLAEARVLRELVEERGWKRAHAARALLKTRSWATHVLRVWKLPDGVLEDVLSGAIPFSHAMVLARYVDRAEILSFLCEALRTEERLSRHRLESMARAAEQYGPEKASDLAWGRRSIGKSSWIRVEPAAGGFHAELRIGSRQDVAAALRALTDVLSGWPEREPPGNG